MRTYKIVIVENDEDEQFFMEDGFEKAGELFEIVAQVRNGDMLFEWLEQQNDSLPDVVLSDLNMPGMNGYDVITGMKNDPRYGKIPVIITSTSSTPTIIDKCLGLGASLYALRLLQSGRYKYAIVVGADRFTRFVLSGFQSFQAIADEPCKPFDAHRKGINLGEAAATIVLSTDADEPLARLVSASTSNDANHISGPSRTGEELAYSIDRSMKQGQITADQVSMISAHGTATLYNDEMESKAFGIAKLSSVPLHSFKGYIGHTLGAAGVVESAMIIESIRRQQLIPSPGFSELGVSQPLNVVRDIASDEINFVLKTASGFGGCNASAIWARPQ